MAQLGLQWRGATEALGGLREQPDSPHDGWRRREAGERRLLAAVYQKLDNTRWHSKYIDKNREEGRGLQFAGNLVRAVASIIV